MSVELTKLEAQILIAALTDYERRLLSDEPMARALADLREWRTALLCAYLTCCRDPSTEPAAASRLVLRVRRA